MMMMAALPSEPTEGLLAFKSRCCGAMCMDDSPCDGAAAPAPIEIKALAKASATGVRLMIIRRPRDGWPKIRYLPRRGTHPIIGRQVHESQPLPYQMA